VALVALNKFWNLNLPVATLEEIAAKLGSDVPFFVRGGTQLSEGRGEKLTPLPAFPTTWLVLLYPDVPMPPGKTGELYKMLGKNDYTNGGVTRALVDALGRGEPPSQSHFYNSFEHVVYERFPQIDLFRQALVEVGADYVRVSGSGPTLFSTFPDEQAARRAADELTMSGFIAFAVKTLTP
jgi:4-diphosphocytidyl-2-C-methyl-D-erythritol kinase